MTAQNLKSANPKPSWFVYLIECKNGRLYTGITKDLEKRFAKHMSGKGAMFTRLNRPSHIIATKSCKDRSEASKLECAVKKLSVAQKRSLAATWPKRKKPLPKSGE